MKHYGDITKIDGAKVEKVDVITFGAPCQDLSVAGKRVGMKSVLMGDEEQTRSGLFFDAIRIIKEMRADDIRSGRSNEHIRPRFAIYENVAGAFSSNGGADWKAVLEEAAKVSQGDAVIPEPPNGKWTPTGLIVGDGWSIAWRVHDAQYWGVPQRRKRICMLCDFNGGAAGDILFECWRETEGSETDQTVRDTGNKSRSEVRSLAEGVPRNTEPGCEEGQGTAGATTNSLGKTGGGALSFLERAGKPGGDKGILVQDEKVGTLSTFNNQSVLGGVMTTQ